MKALFGNPDSMIFDGDKNFIIFFRCLNDDGRIIAAEFDRIIQKIMKHLLDLIYVLKEQVPGESCAWYSRPRMWRLFF